MVLYERKFVSLHHKTDKRTKITFKRRFCYNYKEALKMKLLIYLLLLLTMPLAAQGKTDEKTLLDCIDKMIENDQYYQGILNSATL